MGNSEFIPVCEPLLDGNEEKYVVQALRNGWISSSGAFVSEFEERFAAYCGRRFGLTTTSGTTSLHLALLSAGVTSEHEVILPDFTMVSTLFAVLYCGARPVFVDVD
ncbi:MAG: DegT/DnrJ/EryC1/StrS family aminotransferase, partial [Acidobacteriota bacterium]|nr:DegT/DnrJ/EryC1/StrS family aminotransferase [Acidobacteriota bacterium]